MTTPTPHTPARLTPAAAALLLLAAACTRTPPRPVRLEWPTMGTLAALQCADPAAAPQARDTAQRAFDHIEAELSQWDPSSPLSAVNQAAGQPDPVTVSDTFADVLGRALDLAEASDGAFNPLVGPLMRAWGFNGAAPRDTPPSEAERRAAAALADWRDVSRAPLPHGAAVRLTRPGMRLDLGALAKGYAVDLAWERLAAAGHTNLLVDLAGNLRALGEAAPGRGGWRTGIRNPFEPDALAAAFLLAPGEAVATSGNYERFVVIGGVRYAHLLDPRTGTPVTGTAGVTVTAPTAALADGLSTALFVLGPRDGAALLRRYPGCDALWIPDTPGTLTLLATPGLAARLKPFADTSYTLLVQH